MTTLGGARWMRAWARLLPPGARRALFVPACRDLRRAHLERTARYGPASRADWILALRVSVLALQCLWLHRRTASAARREMRAGRIGPRAWTDELTQDLAYGARTLRKAPGFTIAAIAMLALGTGVNLTAFQVVNASFLRPLPVRAPESLYQFVRRSQQNGSTAVPYPALAFYREHNAVLAAVLGAHTGQLAIGEVPFDWLEAHYVSADYFVELGVEPAVGRLLSRNDDLPDANPVAVLSAGSWVRHFGADPSVVGGSIRLNGNPVTIVGVAPSGFAGVVPGPVDVWLPLVQYPYFNPGSALLTSLADDGVQMYARLDDGISSAAAEDGLRHLVREFHALHPEAFANGWRGEWLQALPAGHALRIDGDAAAFLALVGGLTLLVLTVACANVGNLMLARGVARHREIAVRRALGAGRWRLIRQLLAEASLVALAGTGVGLLASFAAAAAMLRWIQAPPGIAPAFDVRVAAATLALTASTVLLFGLAPTLRSSRAGRPRERLSGTFIAAQVAASCTLLVLGGLLARAVHEAATNDPGFGFEHVAVVDPLLTQHGVEGAAALAYLDGLENELLRMGGVESVGRATVPPLGDRAWIAGLPDDESSATRVYLNAVDDRYLDTMGISIVRGRNFRAGERDVAIVSESLAAAAWPDTDPLGRSFESRTVVGVAGNARTVALRDGQAVEAYVPLDAEQAGRAVVLVKTTGHPRSAVAHIQGVGRALDARVVPAVTLLDDAFTERLWASRAAALVVTLLGGLATILAAAGIFAVLAYTVTRRSREFGIQVALGARGRDVTAALVRRLGVPLAVGLTIGLAAASGLSSVLRHELYGVSSLDPISYGGAAVLLSFVCALAAALPTARALRVDAATALRSE